MFQRAKRVLSATTSAMSSSDAGKFVEFVDASPSPFHAVATAVSKLEAAGFSRLTEKEPWALEAGGKYYFTRNESTVVRML